MLTQPLRIVLFATAIRCNGGYFLPAFFTAVACRATAQSGTQRLVGILVEGRQTSFPLASSPVVRELVRGMAQAGYVEERDYALVFRFADGDYTKLPVLARELVARKPDVLMTSTVAGTLALKDATATIPIVHPSLTEPIQFGFIDSLARPNGQARDCWQPLTRYPVNSWSWSLSFFPVSDDWRVGECQQPFDAGACSKR